MEKSFIYGKNINILYNDDTNFYVVIFSWKRRWKSNIFLSVRMYKKCHIKVTDEYMRAKQKIITTLRKNKQSAKKLWGVILLLDFSCICSLFLVANQNSILHHTYIQKPKLKSLVATLLGGIIIVMILDNLITVFL